MRTKQNLLSEKEKLTHMKTTKPSRSPSVTGSASNQCARPRLSYSSRYRTRFAQVYPGYRDALNHRARMQSASSALHATHRSCMRAQLGSIKRGSHLHTRHGTPSAPRANAISLRCQSQARPGYPTPMRADCRQACPSCERERRRPRRRGWSPRCRNAFQRTACPPR